MEKISKIDIKQESEDIDIQLTNSYFHLIEKVLLSNNLKFPIERTNFLPGKDFKINKLELLTRRKLYFKKSCSIQSIMSSAFVKFQKISLNILCLKK